MTGIEDRLARARLSTLSFVLPDEFVRVPLEAVGNPDSQAWREFAGAAFPGGDDQLWGQLSELYAGVGELQAASGFIGAAMCCGRVEDDEDRVSAAYLTFTVEESNHTDPQVAAEGILRVLTDGQEPTTGTLSEDGSASASAEEVWFGDVVGVRTRTGLVFALTAAGGPAVAVLRGRRFTLPAEADGEVPVERLDHEEQDLGQTMEAGLVQVYLPHPEEPALVLMTLMTPNVEDFPDYAVAAAEIAKTLRFTPAPAERDGDEGAQ